MLSLLFSNGYSFQGSNKTRPEQHDGIHFVTSHFTENNAGWSTVLLWSLSISFFLRFCCECHSRSLCFLLYSTLNKITQFWLIESSTINPKLYSVGVPIKFPWKRRNFVECTIDKKITRPSRTIQGVIKTITKFSNVIGYQQPDLGINWTCSVRVMLVIGNYASFLREMLHCTLLSNLLGFSASITTF